MTQVQLQAYYPLTPPADAGPPPEGGGTYLVVRAMGWWPLVLGAVVNLAERFWAKVDASAGPDGRRPWLGTLDPAGYGGFWDGGGMRVRDRVAYELASVSRPATGRWGIAATRRAARTRGICSAAATARFSRTGGARRPTVVLGCVACIGGRRGGVGWPTVQHRGKMHYAGVYRTLAEADAAAQAKSAEPFTERRVGEFSDHGREIILGWA